MLRFKKGKRIYLIIAIFLLFLILFSVFFLRQLPDSNSDVNYEEIKDEKISFSVGDIFGNLKIESIGTVTKDSLSKIGYDDLEIKFSGKVLVKGDYSHFIDRELSGFDAYCVNNVEDMSIDKSLISLISSLSKSYSDFYKFDFEIPLRICFQDRDFVKKELGDSEINHEVIVELNNLVFSSWSDLTIFWADLANVVSK